MNLDRAVGEQSQRESGLRLSPDPGIAERETFLERWTAHGVAAALNADPEIRVELSPRLNPNGRIDGDQFIFADTVETILARSENGIEILRRCDGTTPAYPLATRSTRSRQLAAQNMIRWEVEVPALEPYAFDILVSDILRWRDNPVRDALAGLA